MALSRGAAVARIRQVDCGDPVSHLARAAEIVALYPHFGLALLDLPSLIDCPDPGDQHATDVPPVAADWMRSGTWAITPIG